MHDLQLRFSGGSNSIGFRDDNGDFDSLRFGDGDDGSNVADVK